MLYLNSIENAEASPTENKYAICHEEVPSMQNIPELAPSRELLSQWQSQEIGWEKFHKQFIEEMRTEYLNGEMSRLRGLANYSLENDVTLHSPEPRGEQTYRTILEEIINGIWKSKGETARVTNLAREPVKGSQLIEGDPQQTSTTAQEEIANLVLQKILPEVASAKDNEIQLVKNNAELKRQIQSLQDENGNKDKKNNELEQQLAQLEKKISTKEEQIQSLQDENHNKGSKNDGLKKQIVQLQDLNTHPRIRDIVVKATGNDSVSGEYFRTIDIDNNLPEILRNELMARLKQSLNIGFNDKPKLGHLIKDYTNFDGTDPDKFDESDYYLAHVIRTQRNLIAFGGNAIDERTRIGRAFCCFFAAALLSPKLSKSDHTSAESPKAIKPKLDDAEAHYKRGTAYRREKNYNRAIVEYTKAIELKPDYTDAYYNRGEAYIAKGDHARAQADFDKAKQL